MQRDERAIAREKVPARDATAKLHLHALERGVDRARRAAGVRLLRQHVPRLERAPQLELDAVVGDLADERKAKLEVRREPRRLEDGAAIAELEQHVAKVLRD